jgi:hypothetical protein
MNKPLAKESTERVAGNGLLHRRALLGRGLAFAGVVGASGVPTGAAAEPLVDAPWSLEPGDAVPAYQLPSKFAKDVARTLANPNFEPRTSQSRTPHHLLASLLPTSARGRSTSANGQQSSGNGVDRRRQSRAANSLSKACSPSSTSITC